MKTKKTYTKEINHQISNQPKIPQIDNHLLSKPITNLNHRNENNNLIYYGEINSIDKNGLIKIKCSESQILHINQSMIQISEQDIGKTAAFSYNAVNGNPTILGFIYSNKEIINIKGNDISIETKSGNVTITAENELELRCGDSRILLESNGKITIRGKYINSNAEAGNRIRGGSVQIN